MKYFDDDIDWLFCFCKTCWDFKKFIFEDPLNFESRKPVAGHCTTCQSIQMIAVSDAKAYYEALNQENN